MKITVLDGYALNPGDLSWEGFEKLGDLTVYERTAQEDLIERAKDSEAIIVNKALLDSETLRKLPKLKYIGVTATGYNIVDVEAAKDLGIAVTNIPAYSTMSVAQHVFALLLSVTDHSEHYSVEVSNGRWNESRDFCFWDTPLIELAGKKFGIMGMGNIGTAVSKIALAFGMEVLAYTSKDASELPNGVTKVSIEQLMSDSDIISLHCPLTHSTKQIINKYTISRMKPGVILINTGRGLLVDEKDVAEGLKSGKIRAYCADVLSNEPPLSDNPLVGAPNAYITPHIAWATKEARTRLMDISVSNLRHFLEGVPTNMVNL